MNTIKQNGFYKGIIYLLLLDLSARITKVLGLAPGGEFRRALIEVLLLINSIQILTMLCYNLQSFKSSYNVNLTKNYVAKHI